MDGQADLDGLKLERAELQQKLNAASNDAGNAAQELSKAREKYEGVKAAMAAAQAELAKITKQRDNAWKVQCLPFSFREPWLLAVAVFLPPKPAKNQREVHDSEALCQMDCMGWKQIILVSNFHEMPSAFAQEMDVLQDLVDEKQSKGIVPLRTQYEHEPGIACADRHKAWRPSQQRDNAEPELAAVLRKVRCTPQEDTLLAVT